MSSDSYRCQGANPVDEPVSGTASGSTADPPPAKARPHQIEPRAESLEATLQRIAELTKHALPGVDEVSMTVIEGDLPRTVVFTGPVAMALDERQYADETGPCLDAAMTGRTITINHRDLATTPYPRFSAAAGQAGIAHTVSVALPDADQVTGGLNLYGSAALPFEGQVVALAESFAAQAAAVITNAAQFRMSVERIAQLRAALDTRPVIEQAKGIIMGRDGCSSDEAFALLVRMSQNQNIKLRDVAATLIGAADR